MYGSNDKDKENIYDDKSKTIWKKKKKMVIECCSNCKFLTVQFNRKEAKYVSTPKRCASMKTNSNFIHPDMKLFFFTLLF